MGYPFLQIVSLLIGVFLIPASVCGQPRLIVQTELQGVSNVVAFHPTLPVAAAARRPLDDDARRQGVHAQRRADRANSSARALRQCLLRRTPSQPPVHGGKPLALFALRQYAGCEGCIAHDPEKWEPVFGKDHAQ